MTLGVLLIMITMLAALPLIRIGAYLMYLGSGIRNLPTSQISEWLRKWLTHYSVSVLGQAMIVLGVIVMIIGLVIPVGIWLIMVTDPSAWIASGS